MSESPRDAVTIQTWIDCGLRLGFTAERTLELARGEGYGIRRAEFLRRWRESRQRFVAAGIAANGDGG